MQRIAISGQLCSVDGCTNPARYAKTGWCTSHYERWRRRGRVDLATPIGGYPPGRRPVDNGTCREPGCDARALSLGVCKKHYTARWRAELAQKTCTVDGCPNPQRVRGLCSTHYYRQRNPEKPQRRQRARIAAVCSVEGCDQPHSARDLCQKHYSQAYGYPRKRALRKAVQHIDFDAGQLQLRLSMFGACWMCGAEATAVDHVKPVAKGGGHLLANLRPACQPCNSRKGSSWWSPVSEFLAWCRGLGA